MEPAPRNWQRFLRSCGWALLALLALTLLIMLPSELRTLRHGHEFVGAEQQTQMLSDSACHKVLSYRSDQALVYYVGPDYCHGNLLLFQRQDGEWRLSGWHTVWSTFGSADGCVWRYWWHPLYARLRS